MWCDGTGWDDCVASLWWCAVLEGLHVMYVNYREVIVPVYIYCQAK